MKNTAPGGKLCKVFRYDESEQALRKETNAYLSVGSVAEETFGSIEAFMERRAQLQPDEALMMGRPIYSPASIRTQKALRRMSANARRENRIIARDREHMSWAEGPSIVMLDIDNPDAVPQGLESRIPDSPESWRDLILECIPGLERVPMAWAPSSSSHIYGDGEEVHGLRGQRFYFVVESGLITEQFKEALRHALTMRGLMWFMVSKSGALLERFPFDLLVYQPERLDFAAGPECHPPLAWRPDPWKCWNSGGPYLTSAELPTISESDARRAKAIRLAKRREMLPEARQVRERWVEATGRRIALQNEDTEPQQAAMVAHQAVQRGVLLPEFVLTDSDGKAVKVADILAAPDEFEERRFHDPLEPDYRNDPRIAVCLVGVSGAVRIYSHAHGGQTWRCERQIIPVRLGLIHKSVDEMIAALASDSCSLYRHGDSIVHVDDEAAQLQSLDPDGLALRLQRAFDVRGWDKRSEEWVPKNIPLRDLKALMSETVALPIPNLKTVTRGPFARADGSAVDLPGYDPVSEVLYLSGSRTPPQMREGLGVPEAEEALRALLHPFSGFPLKTDLDRGVLLAAVLSAVTRQSLDIAPGYLIGAPTAGSGKTTLAESLGALQAGARIAAAMLPERDEEIRKQVFAALRRGASFLVFDNVERGSEIKSPVLANLITSPYLEQRVLGHSLDERRPNRLTLVFTGNNVVRHGDLNRRILPIWLDPGMERPETRAFEFEPVTRILANWIALRIAALEVIGAWRQDGGPLSETASGFAQWDRVVRATVCWVINRLDVGFGFEDPAEAFKTGHDEDPEAQTLGRLLEAWYAVFGDKEIQSKDVDDVVWKAEAAMVDAAVQSGDSSENAEPTIEEQLAGACQEAVPHNGSRTRRTDWRAALGRYLARNADRVVRGLRLEKGGETNGSRRWRVCPVENGAGGRRE